MIHFYNFHKMKNLQEMENRLVGAKGYGQCGRRGCNYKETALRRFLW